MNQYKGFYKRTIEERRQILGNEYDFESSLHQDLYNHMIENAITTYDIPMGIAPQFLINGSTYQIPMVTEEPSVIAAASNGGKIVYENGGFQAHVLSRQMRGEIAFANPRNLPKLDAYIKENMTTLFDVANKAHPSIVKRGGGIQEIKTRMLFDPKNTFYIIDVWMDTQEAMGANMMNTVLEALAHHLEITLEENVLMAILTNLNTECLVEATCVINPSTLKHGFESAESIVLASDFAKVDPYRAATHNKGIMNGVDALVIATGNDWRAVNAGVHAYASLSGSYQPLAVWEITEARMLKGTIRFPMGIGSVGGSIGIHPKAKLTKDILQYDNASTLMQIIACVGLAQNLAALNALTSDGIQKGHMALQAKSLALSANTPVELLDAVVSQLQKSQNMNLETAKIILSTLQNTHEGVSK